MAKAYWTPIRSGHPEQERVRQKWAGLALPLLVVRSPLQSVLMNVDANLN